MDKFTLRKIEYGIYFTPISKYYFAKDKNIIDFLEKSINNYDVEVKEIYQLSDQFCIVFYIRDRALNAKKIAKNICRIIQEVDKAKYQQQLAKIGE